MNNNISKQMLIQTMILLCLFVFRNVIISIPVLAQEEVKITGTWNNERVTIPIELSKGDRIIGEISLTEALTEDKMHVFIISPSDVVLIDEISETPIYFDYTAEISGKVIITIIRVWSLGSPEYNITYIIHPVDSTQPPVISTEPIPTTTEPIPTTTEPIPTTTEPIPTTTEPIPTTTEPIPTTTEPPPTSPKAPSNWTWLIIGLIVVGIVLAFVIMFYKTKRKKHPDKKQRQSENIIIEDLPQKCKRCGGEGKVKQLHEYIQHKGEGVSEKYIACPDCNGTGRL
jgi:hypothetical protein